MLPGTNSHSSGALHSIGEGATRLALRKVEESFYFFLQKGLAISTRKCYEAGQRRFLFLCDSVNLLIYHLLRNLFLYLFCILVVTRDLARLCSPSISSSASAHFIWPTFCRDLSAFPVIMYQAHPRGCHDRATSPYYTDHPKEHQTKPCFKTSGL